MKTKRLLDYPVTHLAYSDAEAIALRPRTLEYGQMANDEHFPFLYICFGSVRPLFAGLLQENGKTASNGGAYG